MRWRVALKHLGPGTQVLLGTIQGRRPCFSVLQMARGMHSMKPSLSVYQQWTSRPVLTHHAYLLRRNFTEPANRKDEEAKQKDMNAPSRPMLLAPQVAKALPQTKEDLLKNSKSWLGRLLVRFKWLMIRQQRKFNTDDLSALFSWIIWGHILWIVLGTTTFISLLVWLFSKASAGDVVAKFVSNVVTRETGLRVVFENAILPDLKQGTIVLRNVFLSRRPGSSHKAQIGSCSDAIEAAAVEAQIRSTSTKTTKEDLMEESEAGVDGNYTQFDVSIDTVAITLSLSRWLAGEGLIRTAEIKGVRGIIDRRFIVWDEDHDSTLDRVKPRRGGFSFKHFKVEDVSVDILYSGVSRPVKLCIYSCELPQLRRQWLFYDFLNANSISGSYDNSLLTLHPRQLNTPQGDLQGQKQRIQRLRIDHLDVHHLNRWDTGMFGWIDSGSVDFLADITLPNCDMELSFKEKVQDVLERWEALVVNQRTKAQELETSVQRAFQERVAHKLVSIELRVQLNDARAVPPLYSPDLTYVNNALIHPIIGYINSHGTFIPVRCRVLKRLLDFDGSWTVYDSNLMPEVSSELYEACVKDVANDEARRRRIRKVGFWSLQLLAQIVLLTLGIVA